MNRGFYAMATGMLVERQRMDVITNNIVNVETTGFKKDTMVSRSFSDVLVERINDPNVVNMREGVGDINHGVHIDEIKTYFEGGALEVTERPLDVAIEGEGMFVIDTPEGLRYTRDGNFTIDVEGTLLTADGYAVMGQNGPITLTSSSDISIGPTGIIVSGGQEVGRLQIVTVDDYEALRKDGNNRYYIYGDAQTQDADGYTLRQGALENSNVDIGREMVNLMVSARTYETGQKILRIIDETMDKAVNRIASV